VKESVNNLPDNFGEIIDVIDKFLSTTSGRNLIDSNEIQDFCLDLRILMTPKVDN